MYQPGQQSFPPNRRPPGRLFSPKSMLLLALGLILLLLVIVIGGDFLVSPSQARSLFLPTFVTSSPTALATSTPRSTAIPRPTATPTAPPFDPDANRILPDHRIVAFYAVPGAEPTGPAYQLTPAMVQQLQDQGKAYEDLDPAHPVQLGIDLVVSVPDGDPGPSNTYSHHVDADTIQQYIDVCQANNFLLFLDLNIGWAQPMDEVNFFLPYLEKYSFVHMAIDPEWMFPRHTGIPGTNLSNVSASDLNPIITALAELPMKYHVPRKILILHQYRGDGDELADPTDASQAEYADKRNLRFDPRVDTVMHIDSVGGFPGDHDIKKAQYEQWVKNDMLKYQNFQYGGFKIFYHLESKTSLMTPQEVLALDPAPMVITYGN
ncbi:hypothetical protein [Tengunoibacter tsumagoiensis]|uniref:Lipoprotein n=1 Tax=Tengunoibacter tsumagoiensis TaxID=2014871 RepID=A0A402A264_9CHLR|nr:hypothetical protein [Tengunoibacter tsumagoiensis]GCE13139.1 hypothetical protein KTT_29980 [Tengunoibacter tsumagoiensis]